VALIDSEVEEIAVLAIIEPWMELAKLRRRQLDAHRTNGRCHNRKRDEQQKHCAQESQHGER
jgi:hypothetical protein